jgi:DNA polymerase-4
MQRDVDDSSGKSQAEGRRKIIHIDMDAFYASVEQRDNPAYRNKPIAVGGMPTGRGGVVATASYEARKFGVRSAMPSRQAKERCPDLIFVKPRFEAYKAVSVHVREIFSRYTDLIEPLSLDEAYLDVTQDKLGIGSAIDIAKQIRQAISSELQLTASAGVSINKFVAKIASDMNKPDGLTFIGPSKIESFMEALPVEKFFGVGKVTATRMKQLGLFTGLDLKKLSRDQLINHFGKSGSFFYNIVRGIDERKVIPHRETKSIGAEDTFGVDLRTAQEILEELDWICDIVSERVVKRKLEGRTITVKIKFHDFKLITRSKSIETPISDAPAIKAYVQEIINAMDLDDKRVRLAGVTLSNFHNDGEDAEEGFQLPLGL